jgi:hypothetical protein
VLASNTSTSISTQPTKTRPSRAHDVAVQFDVWGPQHVMVRASSGGSRGGRPYVAVTVGECLTYVYDHDALVSYLSAWREAAALNRTVRLSEFGPLREQQQAFAHGAAFGVVANITGEQHTAVVASTEATGRQVLTVIVGGVAVRVHTTTALLSYVNGWTRADTPGRSSSSAGRPACGPARGAGPQRTAKRVPTHTPGIHRSPTTSTRRVAPAASWAHERRQHPVPDS